MAEIRGVKFETFDTVPELISFSSSKYGKKTAVSYYADKSKIVNKSYSDLHFDVMKTAEYFKDLNSNSKFICLIGECSYEWIVSFYAISWAGAVPVLIDSELSDEDTYKLIMEIRPGLVILDKCGRRDNLTEKLNANSIATIGTRKDSHTSCVENLLDNIDLISTECSIWSPKDTALIVFTSGTTGKHKAVMLSHKNLCADLFVSYFLAGEGPHFSTVAVLPVHHMLQLTAGIQAPIYIGCPICIGKGKRYIPQSIKQFKPSILVLVPSVIEMVRKKIWADVRLKKKENQLIKAMHISNILMKIRIDVRKYFFSDIHTALGSNLKTIISGGAPIDNTTVQEFRSWGINIFNGYGITECSPVVSCNMQLYQRDGSVGISNLEPYCTVKIIDGEICVSGDIVMNGYYNDKVTTDDVIQDGWFKTGDLGYIDEEGYLFITGRKKNLIILSNGENISPEELELFYSKINGIKDIVIFSKSVGRETILASIIVVDESDESLVGINNLQEYFEEEFCLKSKLLPSCKRVYQVAIRNTDFIKSSNGKIKRIEENYVLC